MSHFMSINISDINNELLEVINEKKNVDASDLDRLIAKVQWLSSQALPSQELHTLGTRVHELTRQIERFKERQKIIAKLHEAAELAIRGPAQQVLAAAVDPIPSAAPQAPSPSAFQDEDPRFESVVLLNQWLGGVNQGESTLQVAGLTEAALKEMIERIKHMHPLPMHLPLYGAMLCKNLCSLAAHVDHEYGNKDIVVHLLALALGKPVDEMERLYESTPKPPRGVPRFFNLFVNLTNRQLAKLADADPTLTELEIESSVLTQAAATQIARFTNLRKLVINGSIENSPPITMLRLPKTLEILHLHGLEALQRLNLEDCPKLTEVQLSHTGLAALKFSDSSHMLKTVNLVGNQSLQIVQLPEQANSLESFGIIGPTSKIEMPEIAPNLQNIQCLLSNITTLTLPTGSHKIRTFKLKQNNNLTTVEWPSKDRHRKEPCLPALEEFDCSLTPLRDLSALAAAEKLRILKVSANPQIQAVDVTRSTALEYAEICDCANLASLKLYPSLPGLRVVRIVLSPKLIPATVTRLEGDPWKVRFEKHDRDTLAEKNDITRTNKV